MRAPLKRKGFLDKVGKVAGKVKDIGSKVERILKVGSERAHDVGVVAKTVGEALERDKHRRRRYGAWGAGPGTEYDGDAKDITPGNAIKSVPSRPGNPGSEVGGPDSARVIDYGAGKVMTARPRNINAKGKGKAEVKTKRYPDKGPGDWWQDPERVEPWKVDPEVKTKLRPFKDPDPLMSYERRKGVAQWRPSSLTADASETYAGFLPNNPSTAGGTVGIPHGRHRPSGNKDRLRHEGYVGV